jgi:hypothetical protein
MGTNRFGPPSPSLLFHFRLPILFPPLSSPPAWQTVTLCTALPRDSRCSTMLEEMTTQPWYRAKIETYLSKHKLTRSPKNVCADNMRWKWPEPRLTRY